ncbi:MAG TPA: glycosyltransferase family 4 protein [Acidimicrobiales bacterium]|nr:glycosyltransferase family 4 protein [Acidimicrobiales bacterium]
MRVLTIIHLYPPHHLGGYEVACRGAMEHFCAEGHDVMVLCSDWRADGVAEDPLPGNLEVRRQLRGWWDWATWGPTSPRLPERIAVERHNQRALRRALAEFRPDVVSIWNLSMTSWAMATLVEKQLIPIVLTFLDDWVSFSYVFDAWTRMFERRPWARPLGALLGLETRLPTFRGATATNASRMIEDSIGRQSRFAFPGAELVPIGVDTRDFPLTEPENRPWSWRVLYAGRVVAEKGVPTLIKAMPSLPDATLEVVGHAHPREAEAMRGLAERLGVRDRVSWGWASSRADLRERYRGADLVVFPSEWAEPFGIVPLEAMACGVPVIATGTGGSGEFLEDGVNCLLFTPGDPDDLARAARRVASDAALRNRIVTGGAATAREMTMARFSEGVETAHLAVVCA